MHFIHETMLEQTSRNEGIIHPQKKKYVTLSLYISIKKRLLEQVNE